MFDSSEALVATELIEPANNNSLVEPLRVDEKISGEWKTEWTFETIDELHYRTSHYRLHFTNFKTHRQSSYGAQPATKSAGQWGEQYEPGDLQFIQQLSLLCVERVTFADAELEHQMVICVLVIDEATVDQQVGVWSISIKYFHLLNWENVRISASLQVLRGFLLSASDCFREKIVSDGNSPVNHRRLSVPDVHLAFTNLSNC